MNSIAHRIAHRLALPLVALSLCSLMACAARQGALSEQDIGDIEFAADTAGDEACHAAADAMTPGQLTLMRASVNAAIATVQQEGAVAIQKALAPITALDPRYARRISGLVDRLMKRVPPGSDQHIATRIVVALLQGCTVGLGEPREVAFNRRTDAREDATVAFNRRKRDAGSRAGG